MTMHHRCLVPQAQPGRLYQGIAWEHRTWWIVHLPVAYRLGLDITFACALGSRLENMNVRTILCFRPVSWDLLPATIPDLPASVGDYVDLDDLREFGTLEGNDVLALMAACVEPGDTIEFRAAGPGAKATLNRVAKIFADINTGKV